MAELRTADVQQFLATNVEIQEIVLSRAGLLDGALLIAEQAGDQEEIAYLNKIGKDGKNPKKWKRMSKFKVGSNTDKNFLQLCELTPEMLGGKDLTGGIVRIFQLGEESIVVLTVEKDGKIVFIEDVGD